MRTLIAVMSILAAACSVESDRRNSQMTIGFDEKIVTNTTDRIGNAVEDTAAEINRAGQEIRNEARGIDIDVDIRRRPPGNSN